MIAGYKKFRLEKSNILYQEAIAMFAINFNKDTSNLSLKCSVLFYKDTRKHQIKPIHTIELLLLLYKLSKTNI